MQSVAIGRIVLGLIVRDILVQVEKIFSNFASKYLSKLVMIWLSQSVDGE